MKKFTPEQIISNTQLPPVEIKHAELKRHSRESDFRSMCPICEDGILLMRRDQKTFILQMQDNCVLCGRAFLYTDLKPSLVIEYIE